MTDLVPVDNKSIGELRRVLRQRYGSNVQILQNWEGPARGVTWADINNPAGSK